MVVGSKISNITSWVLTEMHTIFGLFGLSKKKVIGFAHKLQFYVAFSFFDAIIMDWNCIKLGLIALSLNLGVCIYIFK